MKRLIVTGQAESAPAIVEEMRESAPGVELTVLAPGVWLAASDVDLVRRWQAAPPIFVRPVCRVALEVPLERHEGDPERVAAAAAELVAGLAPGVPFSVQARLVAGDLPYKPFALNEALSRRAPSGVPLGVRHPGQVVSVVAAEVGGRAVAYVGASRVAENLSDWAGGARRLSRDTDQVSRAEGKLTEALEVFGLEVPSSGRAVDLGAAPGGWTRAGARGVKVLAVDPAALDPRVGNDPGVTWLPTTAERWLAGNPTPVDIAVADMRMDARDAARLMVDVAPVVRAWAVLTLKLPERDPRPRVAEALRILGHSDEPGLGWRIVGARQLFHNRSEITVALRPA
ncbi:MAG: SAM-dependent methyltransferase [Myxococcota bacterium]